MASWFSYLSLSPGASRDTAQLPCFVLPSVQTARFFDRDDVVEKIERHFQDGDSSSSLRSLALYGMGGVGKSHVAMKYLEKKLANKDFNAVFWVNAENPVSIQHSFTDIALKLKLPDTGQASHDENRMILKGWLQQTGTLASPSWPVKF
jgi:Cdc6-like AAA superfamily ATPase